ncbi:MAG: AI-2E family transporter [Bacteroidales bacterium]
MHLSFQKVFYVIATVMALIAILILAKTVLIPLAFAFLIAFILYPLTLRFESWGASQIVSAFLSVMTLLLIIGGGLFLFSNQLMQFSEHLTEFKEKLLEVFTDFTVYINQNVEVLPQLEESEFFDRIKTWLNESAGTLVSQTFSSTANVIFGLFTSLLFAFLVLIYRHGMIRALIHFYPREHREKALNMLRSVQKVGQQYLFGMLAIVLILGLMNSIGLLIIGLENPFLFGYLASVLALIPYIGTFTGAAIPVIYSFITYDSIWMPITIALFFWGVQLIESNFLTPKIVGGHLNLNAFTAILSIIIGASVWGIAGMILFLPLTAMLKTVCQEYEELKPFALLIGKKNYRVKEDNQELIQRWRKRIKTWFSG